MGGAAKLCAMNAHYQEGLKLSAKGRHAEAIARFETALAADPSDTRVLFALGNSARTLGLPAVAEQFFRRVLAVEPERIEALVNLANLLRANGQMQTALALIEPALSRHPQAAELWLTSGSIHRELGNSGTAEIHWREALKFKPDYPAALGNLADLLADDCKTDEALVLYDRALKREPDNAQARLNRAILHLGLGNLKDGWRDYGARLKISGKAPQCEHRLPKWAGGTLKRTRLLVTAEQGVGDELMFASMIGDLTARAAREGGSVILECEKRLVSLFARSFPDVIVKPSQMETKAGVTTAHYHWLKLAGGANAAIEMGSLPRWLRNEQTHFPKPNAYLVPDSVERTYWRNIFGEAIGICWRSGKTGGARGLQYAPLEFWASFIRELPGKIVCVQYDATDDEIAVLQSLSGREILVPQGIDQKQELDRACALLSSLDCVVSAPTAVSWLAAGAGVPTYKILYDKSWTSFGEDYEPFAPSCRLHDAATRGRLDGCFRQNTGSDQPAAPLRHKAGLRQFARKIGGDARCTFAIHRHQPGRAHLAPPRGIGEQRPDRARDVARFGARGQTERQSHSRFLERRRRQSMIFGQAQIKRGHAIGAELVSRHAERGQCEIGGRIFGGEIVRALQRFEIGRHRNDCGCDTRFVLHAGPDHETGAKHRIELGQRARGHKRQAERIAAAHRHQQSGTRRAHALRRLQFGKAEQCPFPPRSRRAMRTRPVEMGRLRHRRIIGDIGGKPAIRCVVDHGSEAHRFGKCFQFAARNSFAHVADQKIGIGKP